MMSPEDIGRTARDNGGAGDKVKSGKVLLGHRTEWNPYSEGTRKPWKTFQKRMNVHDSSFRKVTLNVSDGKS